MPRSEPAADSFDSWSTTAVNLAEHADNPVHTDAGARAAGFDAAIVAGTTVHAYLTRPVVEAWGTDWLRHGWSEVRFIAPVLDAERVECVPTAVGDDVVIEAMVGNERRATLAVAPNAAAVGPLDGHRLPTATIDLGTGPGSYGQRAGDDFAIYREHQLAHPSAWSVIGNQVTKANCVDGPWVHVRSAISHFAAVPSHAVVTVQSSIIDRFDTRAGERVVLDVRILLDGRTVVAVQHESIVRLTAG